MTTTTAIDIIPDRYPDAGPITLAYLTTYPCPELNPAPTRVRGLFAWYPGAWQGTDPRPCDDWDCPLHKTIIDEIVDADGIVFLPSYHVPPGYTHCELPAGDVHAAREDLMQQAPTVWHTFAGTTQCLKPNLCPPCYAELVVDDEVDEVQDTCNFCR